MCVQCGGMGGGAVNFCRADEILDVESIPAYTRTRRFKGEKWSAAAATHRAAEPLRRAERRAPSAERRVTGFVLAVRLALDELCPIEAPVGTAGVDRFTC